MVETVSGPPKLRIAIAHAAFDERRKPGLQRLIDALHGSLKSAGREEPEVYVFASRTREHASTWAMRIWQHVAQEGGDWVVLNDDVEVHPEIVKCVEAMLGSRLVKDTKWHKQGDVDLVRDAPIIALHTTAFAAPSLLASGQAWLSSYWVTGPAYVMRDGAAAELIEWCKFQGTSVWVGNEDSAAMEWLWSRRTPALHSIPALVQHDTSVPSTLGYDHHPLRQTKVPWTVRPELDLTSLDWWRKPCEVHVECPWMPESTLLDRERQRATFKRSGELRVSE